MKQSSDSDDAVITNVVIGFPDVIIPNCDVQSLLCQFTVFDVIGKFLELKDNFFF